MIKLIRYANEGFQNKVQSHLSGIGKPIEGCYVFIEDEQEEMLSYQADYAKSYEGVLQDRNGQARHEILVTDNTPVYMKNNQIVGDLEDVYVRGDKAFVVIPKRPIVPTITIANGMEFPASPDLFVEVSIRFAKEQMDKLLSIYKWLREEQAVPMSATVNTRLSDFCQVILNVNDL